MPTHIITGEEIKILEARQCSSQNWSMIEVGDQFDPGKIRNVHFSGKCVLGNHIQLSDIGLLRNYVIANHAIIERVNRMEVEGRTSFGNGINVNVLNEGGGREVPLYDHLTAQIGYLLATFRHDKELIEAIKKMVFAYTEEKSADMGWVGDGSVIRDCQVIKNVWIDKFVRIEGACLLEEGSIIGEEHAEAKVGMGVMAKEFIIQSGSSVDTGAIIERSFIGQGVRIGKQFSMENCLFFANCEGYHGEAVSVFGGPYTVSHHKSSLLIAGMYSFYNAGSGTNQSNHMYKLGPVHQGIVERGSKTGSFSYLLWPSKVGVFSVVMGKHGGSFDTSDFPFSYLTVDEERTFLTPAMNLLTVGTKRDTDKWPKRDRRKGAHKLDLISFDLFNPFVIQEVVKGIDTLNELYEKTPKEQSSVNFKGVRIKRLMLKSCRKYYEMALQIFLGDQLKKQMGDINPVKEVSKKWLDIGGLVIPENVLENIIDKIKEEGTNPDLVFIRELFNSYFKTYDHYVWSWTVQLLKDRFNIDFANMSKDQYLAFMTNWKESKIRLNNMVLSDAKKEFDANSQIGYGLGESENLIGKDFEITRGAYDRDSFVLGIIRESENIEKEFEKISGLLTGNL